MAQFYSNKAREKEEHSLPDCEVFQLTAEEIVTMDEDLMWEACKKFPLANMNSREREKAIAWAVEESGAIGGWFWQACFPGCLPDGEPVGPFATKQEAIEDAREGMDDGS